MKISFVQSGGFAGLCRGCALDTTQLPPETAQELVHLAKTIGISALGTFFSELGRHLQQDDITLDDGNSEVSVTFDDETLPAAARLLVDYLQKHSRPMAYDEG